MLKTETQLNILRIRLLEQGNKCFGEDLIIQLKYISGEDPKKNHRIRIRLS